MIVTMMAITPSLKASSRFVVISDMKKLSALSLQQKQVTRV
jgi:hypothetical protein